LIAAGTADAPIIFTSIDDPNVPGGVATIPPAENVGVTGAVGSTTTTTNSSLGNRIFSITNTNATSNLIVTLINTAAGGTTTVTVNSNNGTTSFTNYSFNTASNWFRLSGTTTNWYNTPSLTVVTTNLAAARILKTGASVVTNAQGTYTVTGGTLSADAKNYQTATATNSAWRYDGLWGGIVLAGNATVDRGYGANVNANTTAITVPTIDPTTGVISGIQAGVQLIEGMAIAGFAVGADKGYVYIRSEYPHAIAKMEAAIQLSAHLVAPFVVEVRVGAGAYVCGEETSLLNSLEGKRGEVRAKPPLPALEGLFGKPTVVNNVLTLAALPWILTHGGDAYAAFGAGRSRGTMPIQIAGNVKHGGLYEVAFGITLGELVNDIGGGTASGRPVRCVQVGGPLGAYLPPAQFHLPLDYEAFAAADALVGHAGITVFDDTVDMAQMARFAMEFCAIESCGKCTPCRLGSTRGVETIDQIIAGKNVEANLALIADLSETMKFGSLCALGGFTPYPVMSAITHFPEDFR
jgi:NADH:ubiquinone oxidoreductase subunit F (NADH-binding)